MTEFRPGDRVRLTGKGWEEELVGVGAVVTVSRIHGEWGYAVFDYGGEEWFIFKDEYGDYSAEAVEAAAKELARRPMPSREALLATVRSATAEYFREDIPEDGRDESDHITDAVLALFKGAERG